MAIINIEAVNSRIQDIDNNCSNINSVVDNIMSDFFEGISSIWNSKHAYEFVSSVKTTLNSTIDSINKSLYTGEGSALQAIHSVATAIATSEQGTTVNSLAGSKVKDIIVSWTGLENGYNLPDADFDLTGFADDTILVKLSNLIEILSNLREDFVNIGSNLGESYVGNAISSIESTINEISDGIENIKSQITNALNSIDEDRKNKVLKVS